MEQSSGHRHQLDGHRYPGDMASRSLLGPRRSSRLWGTSASRATSSTQRESSGGSMRQPSGLSATFTVATSPPSSRPRASELQSVRCSKAPSGVGCPVMAIGGGRTCATTGRLRTRSWVLAVGRSWSWRRSPRLVWSCSRPPRRQRPCRDRPSREPVLAPRSLGPHVILRVWICSARGSGCRWIGTARVGARSHWR